MDRRGNALKLLHPRRTKAKLWQVFRGLRKPRKARSWRSAPVPPARADRCATAVRPPAPSRGRSTTRQRLGLRELPGRRDLDQVAHLALVVLVVRVELARLHDDLAVQRVLDPPLDQHRHRLVHLVADHAADERLDQRLARRRRGALPVFAAVRSCCLLVPSDSPSGGSACARGRCRAARSSAWTLSVSCCVAACMRRPNCSLQQRLELRLQLGGRLARERLLRFGFLHDVPGHPRQPPIRRCTNVVRIGSLADASANASRASASSTPSIS